MGLPPNASLCTSGTTCGPREEGGNRIRTRIIPEISFTCFGTVTGWRAVGMIRVTGNRQTNSVLSIWKERSNGSGTYDRVSGIKLGICGDEDPAPLVMSNIYECILPQTVLVQPGYIVGIELPQENDSKFGLYFNSQGGQTNYVFDGRGTTFSLSQAISSELDQPQISLTIVPDITTTVLPTTQPSTTTEASSTMAGLTTQPPVTSTPMATTELEAPTSTEASSTMATTTEASTTTMITEVVMTNVNSESTTAGSTTTEMPASTTDVQTPNPPRLSGGEAAQSKSNTGTVAGAAVGAIIAVLLVLIIVLLLVLVLRRQSRNGQKFTPSSDGTIANPIYNGKPIVPSLGSIISLVMNITFP